MEGFGRLNILIGSDSRYCAECGAPEMDDGCSNAYCWRARSNAKFTISLALQKLAIGRNFSPATGKEDSFHHCFSTLRRTVSIHGFRISLNAAQHV